ncbi:hypothetical protein B0H14DRAFT_3753431 [Mycena olivaceomarginata]|nr:hypothetical protein B0H14DRAFT_3753431 [Mycena olivaceomarginata]
MISNLGDLEETAAQSGSEPASPPHSTAASLNESATVSQEDERNRWNKCGGKVKLYCEVTADDLAHLKIWQVGDHEDAPSNFPFAFSHHLRLVIMERLRRYGAKVTSIQKDLVSQFLRRGTSGDEEALPAHCLPTTKQIKQMLPAVRHRARLDRNPFRATHIMVHRNPEKMYYYKPHDFSAPDEKSEFTVAITDNFSLDSTILNTCTPDGIIFVDSTHRLQNENRAATTVFCTADSERHMMPGTYLISAKITAPTLEDWILETIQKISLFAMQPFEPSDGCLALRKLMANGRWIAKRGFKWKGFMIDKSLPELKALEAVLKWLGMEEDVYIRLCQFHVIQAILNWHKDKENDHGIGFTLSHELKFEICVLFRTLQRCHTWDAWPNAKSTFYEGLELLLSDVAEPDSDDDSADSDTVHSAQTQAQTENKPRTKKPPPQPRTKHAKQTGLTCYETVRAYFEKNWFVHRWIPLFTDIGLPSDQSRDGPWNTNNWAETAFKQFNTIFLDNKHNKRIDRLASIILNDHLPYFCFFPTPTRSEPREIREMNLDAHSLWENDLVQQVTKAESPLVLINPKAEIATESKKPNVKNIPNRMREDDTATKELYIVLEKLSKRNTDIGGCLAS